MAIESYRDLVVWDKAMAMATEVYRIAKLMPRAEEYRLTSQILRSAASVSANIAEGHMRGSRADYARFVDIARGSLAETETFLLLVRRVDLVSIEETDAAMALCEEIGRMLNALRRRLCDTPTKT